MTLVQRWQGRSRKLDYKRFDFPHGFPRVHTKFPVPRRYVAVMSLLTFVPLT